MAAAARASRSFVRQVYDGSVRHTMRQGWVQEWTLRGGEGTGTLKHHPYHQHVSHFQVIEIVTADVERGHDANGLLACVGEWRDSVSLYGGIRYAAHVHTRTHVPSPARSPERSGLRWRRRSGGACADHGADDHGAGDDEVMMTRRLSLVVRFVIRSRYCRLTARRPTFVRAATSSVSSRPSRR